MASRSPLLLLPLLAAALLCLASTTAHAQTLVFAQIVFRHGDRSALLTVPAFGPEQNVWPDGLGQLTPLGMTQQWNVGKYFAQRYKGFINDTYHPVQMNVRSTDVDRTLMSAESQLVGWFQYPNSPFNLSWQPIPVHTIPQPLDTLLLPFNPGMCARYDELVKGHAALPARAAKEAELADPKACTDVGLPASCTNLQFVQALGVLSGIPGYSFDTLWELSDTLICRRDHDLLPTAPSLAWARSDAVYYQLLGLENFTMYESFTGTEERRLSGGPLVKQLIENMQQQSSPTTATAQKVQLYSAHDTTVAALLEALNTDHFRAGSPPYATAVQVELYKMGDGTFSVLVILKNESVTDPFNVGYNLTVSGCSSVMCPLDEFIQATADVVPDNWVTECQVSSSGSGKKKLVPLWIGVSLVTVAIVGLVLWFKGRGARERRAKLINDAAGFDEDYE